MPSSSLFLRSSTTLVSVLAFISTPVLGQTVYQLNKEYSGSTFFDESNWNYFTDTDPTHGYVDYLSHDAALQAGLIQPGTTAYMGVDYTNPIVGGARGRPSVRIESKQSWTHGLFITKIDHMPGGICGTWPAFWTLSVSKDWPAGGEIDIIEGANINQGYNVASLHTLAQCTISGDARTMTGTLQTNDCEYYPDGNGPQQNTNAVGCGISNNDPTTFGNQNQYTPHTFAMEWTSDAIRMWAFPQGQEPADIDNNPNPDNWGLPSQTFNGPNCNIDAAFTDHQMIFDNTFCGDYAGGIWQSGGCAALTGNPSCANYVANNPGAFQQAFWSIEYVRVFQKAAILSTTTTIATTTTPGATTLSTSTMTSTTNSVSVNPTLGTTTTIPASMTSGGAGTSTTNSVSVNPTLGTTTSVSVPLPLPMGGSTTDTTSSMTSNPVIVNPTGTGTSSSVWIDWSATTTTVPVQSSWSDWSSATTIPASVASTWNTWANTVTANPVPSSSSWSDWAAKGAQTLTQAIPQSQILAPPAGGCPHCDYEQDQINGFDNGAIPIAVVIISGEGDSGVNGNGNSNANSNSNVNANNNGNWNTWSAGGNGNVGSGNTAVVAAGAGAGAGGAKATATSTIQLMSVMAGATPSANSAIGWSAWNAQASASTNSATGVVVTINGVPTAAGTWAEWNGNANATGAYSGPVAKYTGAADVVRVGASFMAVVIGLVLAFVL